MAADKKIEVVLELKNGQYVASVKEAGATTKKFKQDIDSQAAGIAGGFQKIYNAAKAYLGFKVAQYFVNLTATFSDVKTSFEALTSTIEGGSKGLLKSIQTAAQGTVSQLDIMKSSNLAITLMGEDVAEYLPRMMEIAKATAQSQGVEVQQMFNDIIVASGRQSVQIMDNLGISSVTAGQYMEEYARKLGKTRLQLNDTEKRAAFFYATMKAGGEIVDKTGQGALTLGQRIQKLKAGLEDSATTLGERMIPGLQEVIEAFTEVNTEGESLLGTVGNWLNDMLVLFAVVIRNIKMVPAQMRQAKDDFFKSRDKVMLRETLDANLDKVSPENAVKIIQNNRDALLKAGFNEDYLNQREGVFKAQGEYSKYQDRKAKKTGAKPIKAGGASSSESSGEGASDKDKERARKFLDSIRQYSMSTYDVIEASKNSELGQLEDLHQKGLIAEEDYQKARAAIIKKHQEDIKEAYMSEAQKWLSIGSNAIGSIMELYNMATNNRLMQLDAEYAKQVEVINNSTLSEEEKENKIAMLDAEHEAKKKKIQIENARRQKKLAIAQALLEIPLMAIEAYRTVHVPMQPWTEPLAWAAAVAAAGLGTAKLELIRQTPVALAEGGLARSASLAIVGEGKYNEAVLPLSTDTYKQLAEQVEAARAKRTSAASSQVVYHTHHYHIAGDIIDKDGFNKAVYEANREVERRTGVEVYSRKSVYR